MTSFFDQLNLRPQEKRLLAAVLVAVTLVVSAFFVWPKFGEWPKMNQTLRDSQRKLQQYQAEIARIPEYETRLRELEGQGESVLREEQALQLVRTVQTQADQHGVPITSTRLGPPGTSTTSTNQFFDEQTVIIGVTTSEEELVKFLHSLGTGNSMIRVRDMDLRPDQPRYKLNGSITLVASYQKKPPVSRPTTPPRVAAVSTNPAVSRAAAPAGPSRPATVTTNRSLSPKP
jgi:Tfp pilus assembly protein PilO